VFSDTYPEYCEKCKEKIGQDGECGCGKGPFGG